MVGSPLKSALARGQSQRVSMPLDARAFSYWSEADDAWRVVSGCAQVRVGSSSRKLPLRGKVCV
jgi:beta-glucosidase